MNKPEPTLIFVYNADDSFHNKLIDFAHKIVSPQTYNCNLCKITFGIFTEKKAWREFISLFKTFTVFMHKNEFMKTYNIKNKKFPSVFLHNGMQLIQIISADEINTCQSTQDLINLVKQKSLIYGIH